jgi:hypothetical protein
MARLLCFFALSALIATASAQQALDDFVLVPEGAPIRDIPFRGDPILVHLKIGHERAIAFPEPVTLNSTSDPALPGCEVTVDGELVGFYPRESFTRRTFSLTGQSGTRYDLSIRASSAGMAGTLKLYDAPDAI